MSEPEQPSCLNCFWSASGASPAFTWCAQSGVFGAIDRYEDMLQMTRCKGLCWKPESDRIMREPLP